MENLSETAEVKLVDTIPGETFQSQGLAELLPPAWQRIEFFQSAFNRLHGIAAYFPENTNAILAAFQKAISFPSTPAALS